VLFVCFIEYCTGPNANADNANGGDAAHNRLPFVTLFGMLSCLSPQVKAE
jgi:hypothetical protein